MGEETETVPRLFLQPAGLVLAEDPSQVRTILGSCVAVTMRAPRLGLAAAAHCVLPNAGVPAAALPVAEALKYVDTAIELMLMAFATRGVTTQEIEVKLFGGADSLGADVPAGGYCVGSRNIEAALAVLAQRGIVPVAGGVGGRHGRVIDFDTASGEVHVRRLPSRSEGGRT